MLLKVKNVAERLNLSPAKVYQLIDSGKMPHFKIGGALRVSEEQLTEYLDSCRHGRREEHWKENSNPRCPVKLKHLR